MFGKSFDEQVQAAVADLAHLGVRNLAAKVDGKVVTLTGEAPDVATKARVMHEFNTKVETENTLNMIRIAQVAAAATMGGPPVAGAPIAAPPAPAPVTPTVRTHEVVRGETLSAIAKHYYGKASDYTKIFDANKDVLKDPDKIFPGQKLRIP